MPTTFNVHRASLDALADIVKIALACFPKDYGRDDLAEVWHASGLSAYPKTQYFVTVAPGGLIVGFASWSFIGGWQSGVVELEQLGVHPDWQGQGIGSTLINASLKEVKEFLKKTAKRDIRLIKVDTATSNRAQELYRKTLGAEVETVFKNFLYGEDEAIMFKRFDV